MASFSRGFSCLVRQTYLNLPPSLRLAAAPKPIQSLHSFRSTRNLSFSPIRHAAKTAKPKTTPVKHDAPPTPLPKPSKPTKPSKPSSITPQTFNPLRMPPKTPQILLYKAPSQTYYAIVAYAAGTATCLAGAFIFQNFWLDLPRELPGYVAATYGGISILLFALALWIFAAPVWLVRSIHAVPGSSGMTMLRIEGRRLPLPGFKAHVMVVKRNEVQASGFVAPQARMFEAVNARKYKDLWKGVQDENVVLRPFFFAHRWVMRLVFRVFVSTRLVIGRFGQVILDVPEEGKWKLDCSGWVAEGGRPIDQMIRVIPPAHWATK